jgi:hypothetical protein
MFQTMDILRIVFGKEEDPVIDTIKNIFLMLVLLTLIAALLLSSSN